MISTRRLAGSRKPAGSPAAPEPMPQIAAAPEPFIVYFAFDSAAVDGVGYRVIDDAVATANDLGIVDFSITGHADRSGAQTRRGPASRSRRCSVWTKRSTC